MNGLHTKFLLGALACGWLGLRLAEAGVQTASSKSARTYDYLFVVDTSFSMLREKEGLADTVFNLIRTGIADKVRPGDQLGVWTFNERVYSSRFLPENWTPERGEIIADRVARYLRSQRFEGQTRLDKAMAEILKAVKASKSLTVFLLSDGDTPVAGTPFDRSLNLLYRDNYGELQRARKPFITRLVASDGLFVSWAVSADVGAMKVPEAPPSVQTTSVVATNPPPLINPPPVANSTPASRETRETAATKNSVEQKPATRPEPANAPLPETKPPAAPLAQREEPKTDSQSAKIEPAKPQEPQQIIVSNPAGGTSAPAPAVPKPVPTPSVTDVAPPPKTETSPQEAVAMTKPASEAKKNVAATDAVPSEARPAEGITTTITREASGNLSANASSEKPLQQTATIAPKNSPSSSVLLAIGGAALLLIALGLLYWSARSHRHRHTPSVISRSLDRRGK